MPRININLHRKSSEGEKFSKRKTMNGNLAALFRAEEKAKKQKQNKSKLFIKLPEKDISLLEKNEVIEEKRGLGTREPIFVLLGEVPGTGMEYYISKTMENQMGLEIVKTTDDMHLGSTHKIGKILYDFLKEETGSNISLAIPEIEPIDVEEPKTSIQDPSSLRERKQQTKTMNTYHRGKKQSGHTKQYMNRRLHK